MYVQVDIKTGLPKGGIRQELPAEFWLSPVNSVPLTPENAERFGFIEMQTFFKRQVQAWMDSVSNSRGYDDIVSACSYAAAANPFQAESLAFITLRGNVWAYAFTEYQKILAGERAMPDDIGAELAQFLSVLP